MRVSEQSQLTARIGYLEAAQTRMDKLQQQLATGRKLNAPSDDPAGTALALQHRRDIDFEAQMRRNLSSGVAFLNAGEAALSSATDSLQRIRELTVQASNDTMGAQDRQATGSEVGQLVMQLAQLANTNFGGAYIFSGYKTQTAAFQVNGNPPTSVTYVGDNGQRLRQISKQDTAAINIPGSQAFGTMFDDLITLRDNLNSGATGSVISASLTKIDAALNGVLDARSVIGARTNRFDAAEQVSESTDTDLQKLRSDLEEVDLASTMTTFTASQTAYQAALAAIGRTANMSILDYMH